MASTSALTGWGHVFCEEVGSWLFEVAELFGATLQQVWFASVLSLGVDDQRGKRHVKIGVC